MKTVFSLVTFLALASGSAAFAPAPLIATRTSALSAWPQNGDQPELQAAIAEVQACAAEFSDETLYFANQWIDKMLEGKMEGNAAGLLEECVLEDSDRCQRYGKALTKLDSLLGVGMQEQF